MLGPVAFQFQKVGAKTKIQLPANLVQRFDCWPQRSALGGCMLCKPAARARVCRKRFQLSACRLACKAHGGTKGREAVFWFWPHLLKLERDLLALPTHSDLPASSTVGFATSEGVAPSPGQDPLCCQPGPRSICQDHNSFSGKRSFKDFLPGFGWQLGLRTLHLPT